jgi:hypothetical protein
MVVFTIDEFADGDKPNLILVEEDFIVQTETGWEEGVSGDYLVVKEDGNCFRVAGGALDDIIAGWEAVNEDEEPPLD